MKNNKNIFEEIPSPNKIENSKILTNQKFLMSQLENTLKEKQQSIINTKDGIDPHILLNLYLVLFTETVSLSLSLFLFFSLSLFIFKYLK